VPVKARTFHSEEQISWIQCSRIDGIASHLNLAGTGKRSADGFSDFVELQVHRVIPVLRRDHQMEMTGRR
jgi:hypothetical protein